MHVFIDFDGTITKKDCAEEMLIRHSKGDWRTFDDDLLADKIGIREAILKQFNLIPKFTQADLDEFNDFVREVHQFQGKLAAAVSQPETPDFGKDLVDKFDKFIKKLNKP